MKELKIQYPDGRYHNIQAIKFYKVIINSKEVYILEYDDLTTSISDCFTVLIKEKGTFVKKPLSSQAEYGNLYNIIKYMPKKFFDLNGLPNKIDLCKEALTELKSSFSIEQSGSPRAVASAGGLNPPPPSTLVGSSIIHVTPKTITKPISETNNNIPTIIILEDIAPFTELHPFYLDEENAKKIGKKTSGYYHLTEKEHDEIKRKFYVVYKRMYLGILDQKAIEYNSYFENTNLSNELTKEEIQQLEDLFDRLVDFEDYYNFFGIDELRELPTNQVLNSSRLQELTNLFNKARKCGNELGINLAEFLEGFKNELKQKNKKI